MGKLNELIQSDIADVKTRNSEDQATASNLRNVLEVDYNRNMPALQLRSANVKSRLFLKYFKIDALHFNGSNHG